MRWSVAVGLLFAALFVAGIQTSQTPMPVPGKVYAGPPSRPAARGENQVVEWHAEAKGRPFVKRDEARRDALDDGQAKLTEWLRAKYPEIRYAPTADFIDRNKLVKSEKEVPYVYTQDNTSVEMVIVGMDLELTPDGLSKIVQEDRNQLIEGRLWGLARVVGGLVLLFGAVAGSIRL